MSDPAQALRDFKKEKDFLIGIDSDGCAFDTMEIKHKECFTPNIINEWDLQAVSKYAREASEFVNLYSKWRGINRFPALIMVFDLLSEREEVKKRSVEMPKVDSLRKWIETETKLGNPALEKIVKETNDPVLTRTLKWSKEVNNTVAKFVRGVPPFPFVRESLEAMSKIADIIVVSATPGEALVREWKEHGIDKYDKDKVLMIGDANGDMKAAHVNNVHFYPINPGKEDASWERLYIESLKKFTEGKYAGEYEKKLIAEFNTYLPETPPWK